MTLVCVLKYVLLNTLMQQITLEQIKHEEALDSAPDWVHRLLAFLFQGKPPHAMVAPALFAHLRKRGVHVWFLGVNTEADLNLAVSTGATAVLTDRIHWLTKAIKDNNLRFQKIA